jgi:hypothetical protein
MFVLYHGHLHLRPILVQQSEECRASVQRVWEAARGLASQRADRNEIGVLLTLVLLFELGSWSGDDSQGHVCPDCSVSKELKPECKKDSHPSSKVGMRSESSLMSWRSL